MRNPTALMIACLSLPVIAADDNPWTTAAMMQAPRVMDVAPSPDGRRVAFSAARAVMTDEESVYRTTVYTVGADGEDLRRYAFGKNGASRVRWSPDGRWLSYIGGGNGSKPNLYLIAADGGAARQLTDVKTGVVDYRWAPDGRHIAFVMIDPPSEEEEKRAKAKDDATTLDVDFKYQHLWLVSLPEDLDAEAGESTRLTEGSFHVNPGYAPGFEWAPDSSRIAFSHTPTPELNDWTRADISTIDIESRAVTELAATSAAEYGPQFSANGELVAYVSSEDPPSWMRDAHVAVRSMTDGSVVRLADTPDESPVIVGWLNRNTLLIRETAGTRSALMKLPTSGKAPQTFAAPEGFVSAAALNAGASHLAVVAETSNSAAQVFVSRTNRYVPKQVSQLGNGEPRPATGRTERLQWASTDGMQIEGLVTYPVDYQPDRRVPLLLVIHGGPAGVYVEIDIARPGAYPIAAFASAGYAVLRANPRGSGGYGADFRRANQADWGGMDYQDLMAGVDELIRRGVADPDRLGVMGWSYGGFMTSWIVTHTDRFKAASIGAPVTDLIAMNGTSDIPDFLPDYFGGELWEQPELYRAHSPLTHVANAVTPSLIQHGAADARVPLGQGTAFYRALKRRGVNTRMVVYPRAPHGPTEPRQLQHVMQDNLDWFLEHIPAGANE